MIKVNNLKLPVGYEANDVKLAIMKSLKLNEQSIESFRLHRVSIDARKKDNIYYNATATVKLRVNEDKIIGKFSNAESFAPYRYNFTATKELNERPVVVGSGPAGLFAALTLAKFGAKPIVIERGKDVDSRTEDVELFFKYALLNPCSNIQFGEGGAGTFSDGKLNTGTNDSRSTHVLRTFVEFGAQEEILINAKPHIGTDVLKNVIKNIRKEIILLGGEFLFETTVTDLVIKDGALKGVTISNNGKAETIATDCAILAIGHSARDTFSMLLGKGVILQQKPFSMGVRIEHKAKNINKCQYGKFAHRLPTADYKLSAKDSTGRGVYTFCMCPGGYVVNASSEEGQLCTNGMSYSKRDGENSNSAVLVSIYPEDFSDTSPLAGVMLQQNIERKAFEAGGKDYCAPIETVASFINNSNNKFGSVKPTIKPGYNLTKLEKVFPDHINKGLKEGLSAFAKRMPAFNAEDAILTAAETRSSSPVRIVRNERLEAINIKGLYPCGEGAGYAGGIVSAAVDGIKCAEMILTK
ncbi:MAG: FAD-binding protein [Ruminococcus sp.]|nr:FAD-binding protein [Ruminococcus sp.]